MTRLQPADLDRLEQLAREATPGPWRAGLHNAPTEPGAVVDVVASEMDPYVIASYVEIQDAAYIAALSPAVVLSLVARIRELEAAADER